MPNNTRFFTSFKSITNCHSSKHLLITHNVFLVSYFNFAIYFAFRFYISNSIFQNKEQSLRTTHRSNNSVCRCINIKISLILRRLFNYLAVKVSKNLFFNFLVNRLIRIISIKRWYRLSRKIVFSKAIKESFLSCASTIKSTFNWNYTAKSRIFHIVRKNHQLSDVYKATKLFIW